MRLSQERLREEIVRLRSPSLKQRAFVAQYGATIGISDNTTLSRYEAGSRPISDRIVQGYVRAFPDNSELLRKHLQWSVPRIADDKRTLTFERRADGSFSVQEDATTVVDLRFYLVAHCRGREAAEQLRNAVPGLYGIITWPLDADLGEAIRKYYDSDPLVVFRDEDRANQQLRISELALDDVEALGADSLGLPSDSVRFYGADLEGTPGPKTFSSHAEYARRSTLREWRWATLLPADRITHRIKFKGDPEERGSFNLNAFMPRARIVRLESVAASTVTIQAGPALEPGHGWLATWENP